MFCDLPSDLGSGRWYSQHDRSEKKPEVVEREGGVVIIAGGTEVRGWRGGLGHGGWWV